MTTQISKAYDNIITNQMKKVAKDEEIETRAVCEYMADGKIVIPFNPEHSPQQLIGIGKGTKVKVNVNLGVSPNRNNLDVELKKIELAHQLGAHTIMDLSVGENLADIRFQILSKSKLPLGTVPAYEAFDIAMRRKGSFLNLKIEDLFEVIKTQAKQGVDFMTVHAGLTKSSLKRLKNNPRVLGIVSRGGSLIAEWMKKNDKENPLFEYYDQLLDIAYEHDVTLSLGDSLRPGSIPDATDAVQIEELITLAELSKKAKQRGVQVMIEGPGHIPLNQIATNIQIQKLLCNEIPFYVLGPVVCDIAPGYDHITAAIGGSVAAFHGADFLCYVTPAEHLRLPTLEDVKDGIIATKIAAFSADLARGKSYAVKQNQEMVEARAKLNWEKQFEISLNCERAKEYYESYSFIDGKFSCSMCGNFCSIKHNSFK